MHKIPAFAENATLRRRWKARLPDHFGCTLTARGSESDVIEDTRECPLPCMGREAHGLDLMGDGPTYFQYYALSSTDWWSYINTIACHLAGFQVCLIFYLTSLDCRLTFVHLSTYSYAFSSNPSNFFLSISTYCFSARATDIFPIHGSCSR